MKIENLDHVKAISTSEVVGGSRKRYFRTNIKKDADIKFKERIDIFKDLYVVSFVKGNSAFAEADAEAYGKDSNAEGLTFTYTDDFTSAASATSVSQS